MESKSLEIWEHMTINPEEGFQKAFDKEKQLFLTEADKNSLVLDIGCGLGRTVRNFAPYVKKVVGIDNDYEAVEKSKENTKEIENVEIYFGDGEKLDFEDKSFDIVSCMGGTISNLGNSAIRVFSEVKRVLKDEGFFFCSSWNEDALEARLRYYNKYYPNQFEVNLETGYVEVFEKFVSQAFSEDQLRKFLEDNGFQVIEIFKEGFLQIVKSKKEL